MNVWSPLTTSNPAAYFPAVEDAEPMPGPRALAPIAIPTPRQIPNAAQLVAVTGTKMPKTAAAAIVPETTTTDLGFGDERAVAAIS